MRISPKDWIKITATSPREGDEVIWTNGVRVMATHNYKPGITSAFARYPATHYIPFQMPARLAPDLTGLEDDRDDCNVRWRRNYGKAKVPA